MDCVDKNVLIYLILSLPLGNSWKLGVFSPCIESRGDWTSWSTSPLPFGYRIWQVRNPNLVLLPVSTGILKVRLSLFFFSVCGKAVLQQALKSGGFCVLVSERLFWCAAQTVALLFSSLRTLQIVWTANSLNFIQKEEWLVRAIARGRKLSRSLYSAI